MFNSGDPRVSMMSAHAVVWYHADRSIRPVPIESEGKSP